MAPAVWTHTHLIEVDFCVSPESKILKADLTWTNAEHIRVGDELVGFDEAVGQGHDHSFRAATVLGVRRIVRPRVRVVTTHGTVIVAADHPFVARRPGDKRRWVKAKDLRPGHVMAFLAEPWETDTTREGGYLAGFFDGEGWVSRVNVGYGQNPGPTLEYVQGLLQARHFPFRASTGNSTAQCEITSGIRQTLRFLGMIRPARLMAKQRQVWEGRRTWGKRTPVAHVVSVTPLDDGPVIAIETTTKTFISDGFFSHNSGIEAVLVGCFARDPIIYRMAKLGLHAYVASHLIGQPVGLQQSDADIATAFKAVKKAHPTPYNKAKRTVHGCLSGDHEILTRAGWVRLDRYDWTTPLAEWHPTTGAIQFAAPLGRYIGQHQGEMYVINGRGFSGVLTPDHGIPIRTSQGRVKRSTAATLPKANSLPVVGQYDEPPCPASGEPTFEDMRLYVATQADGHIEARGSVRFHLKRARKIARLAEIAQRGQRLYRRVTYADGSTGFTFSPHVAAHWRNWFGPDKTFQLDRILAWPIALRRRFLDELVEWDGTNAGGCRTYLTTSRHNADVVQAVAHCSGRQALLRVLERPGRQTLYRISFNRRTHVASECLTRLVIPWNGTVYCPHTSTGYFLTRHKDRVWVSGNTGYGMTPQGMVLMFPDLYKSLKDAQHVQSVYFSVAPGVKPWQVAVQKRAQAQGYLGGPAAPGHTFLTDENAHPYGYKHYFYGVLSYQPVEDAQRWALERQHVPLVSMNGRWYKVVPGPEAKSCIAFYPQSTAAGILKETLLALFADPDHPSYIGDAWYGRTPLRAPIHDSIFLEAPPRQIDRVLECTYREMLRPVEEIPLPPTWGFGPYATIGVEGKIGRTWDAMETIPTPEGVTAVYSEAAADRFYLPAEEEAVEDVLDLGVLRHAGTM